jgi:hypothetical protein
VLNSSCSIFSNSSGDISDRALDDVIVMRI